LTSQKHLRDALRPDLGRAQLFEVEPPEPDATFAESRTASCCGSVLDD
jgi:hypothetical protein